jgi:diguanylate cyclase (GGDEF)-like protein/PAS domain S-box-containing protein
MPAGFRAMSRDITERKRAEEALHEGESSIRAITDSARDAILMMDPEGRISYWNPAAERILGYTSAEAIGQNMHALIAPSRYHEAHHAAFPVFQQKGQGAAVGKTLDLEARRKDGKEISVQLSLAAIHMKSAWHAVGILRDVTEQMQAQNAIKESEEKFRNIVLWSVDAIIVTDANGKIVFVNPAAGRVFNREVEGFIGTDFALPLADGQSTEIDIFRPGKGQGVGDMYVVETEWMGEKAHLITIRDITERKQIEVKIKNAQEDLFIINNKLEKRNRQNSLLSEMRELLQSCSNGQEVPAIVISYATQLFPGTDGALFLLSDSKSDLQSVARWGDFPEDVDNNIFAPDACWGLRKGHVYAVADMKTGPICRHLKKTSSTAYICLPLIGKGEILGLLHLGTKQSVQENGRQENFSAMKEIAFIFAEYLALSIANIQLSEKLTSQSIRDPLTRLYNRRYMDEIIQHEILRAARQQTGIGVVMVDIDHFKQINDTYGHEAGDEYLIKLAGFFKLKARGSDFVFRYGGEEFMLILPESSIEDTYKYAESLRNEIKNMKVQFRGQALPSITLSFGIAAYPDHGLETIELLRVADKALYRAKEEGRDRVIIG